MKARFHNQMPDIFYHLTNAGRVYLSDMRQSLDLRSQWTEFVFRPAKTHFFTEYIINPSDAHFMSDGFSLVVRDYLQLKIWDIRNNEKPVFSSSVSKAMMMSLGELYESNHIFDKFDLAVAPDSQTAVTGSYKGQFHVMVASHARAQRPSSWQHCQALPDQKAAAQALRSEQAFLQAFLASTWHA